MPKRKHLPDGALGVLGQIIVADRPWPISNEELPLIAVLVTLGLVQGDDENPEGPARLWATTRGVRVALDARVIAQKGTRFDLVDMQKRSPTADKPSRAEAPRVVPPPLRVVEPKAPDPFAEGMDAAMSGQFVTCHYPEGSQEAQDWAAGYQAGGTAKKYVV